MNQPGPLRENDKSKPDLLWGGTRVLNQEGGKLGLRDDGELWVGAADVPFPVRVLRRVGRWKSVGLGSERVCRHWDGEWRRRTFAGRGAIFLWSRTGRGLSVHGWEWEATGYRWIDGDRVTYS